MSTLAHPEELKLSNGIPVILQHYDSPVAATYWWVSAGSADEVGKQAGFAHFLEHMLFKDTDAKSSGRASTGQTAMAIESMGGDINAYTSFDQTVYHVTCAQTHWERVLDVFSSMAKPQKFSKTDFDREREVILEELKKNEDSPGRQIFQKLLELTFSKHPYGRPVIGYSKTLKSAKVSELEAFYRARYSSSQMGIILVGPIADAKGQRKKKLLALLEKRFGKKVFPARESPRPKRPVETALRKAPACELLPFDVTTPSIMMAFRVPNLEHPDTPGLDLISGIAGMGEVSRLYQRLFYRSSLVTDVSAGVFTPRDEGIFYFQAEMDSVEKVLPVAQQIFEELEKLKHDEITADEIARVLVNSESEKLYSWQTADGVAGRLGFLRFMIGDLGYDREYLEELRNIGADRLRELARTYFDPRRLSITALLPEKIVTKEQKKTLESELTACAEKYLTRADSHSLHAKAKHISKDIELIQRPSGIRVLWRERKQSHAFSIHTSVLGGLRLEPTPGAAYLASLTWDKGTSHRDGHAISKIIEGSAASLEGFTGRNTTGIQMTGLARDWKKLTDLLTETMVDPIFPEGEVDHSRRIAEDSVKSVEDSSAQLCSRMFFEALFERHPYARMIQGDLESLARITSRDLVALHRNWWRPERLVVSVVGNVREAQLEDWLTELELAFASRGVKGAAQVVLPQEPMLDAPRWVERKLEREQAHIMVGGLGIRVTDDDRLALRMLDTVLSGQSGPLFVELREKKSLAYSVAPVHFEGIERGYAATYIACSPEKKDEAIRGIKQVLETMAKKGPTPQQMARAREFFLGRRAMELQSDSAQAANFGIAAVCGVPIEIESILESQVRKLAARELQAVCRKYLVDAPMVTSVVG